MGVGARTGHIKEFHLQSALADFRGQRHEGFSRTKPGVSFIDPEEDERLLRHFLTIRPRWKFFGKRREELN
jgi:hypothetical protein